MPAGPARASFRRSHVSRSDGLLEQRPTVEFMVDFTRLAARLEPELTLDDLYPTIGCPTLLVCGQRGWAQGEPLTPELRRRLESLPSRFPHVELAWLDCGHMIPWEQPSKLAVLVTAFARNDG